MLWRKAKDKKQNGRTSYRTDLRMEVLENRLVLAGAVMVDVVSGSLVIKSLNDDDTTVEISQDVPGSDTFFVKGKDGTTVNGLAGKQEFSGISKDIDVRFKDGNDSVKLQNDVEVPRDLLVKGKDGKDSVKLKDGAEVGRDVYLKLDGGKDDVEFKGENYVGRDIIVKAGANDDDVIITDTEVIRNVNLNMGDGDDTVSIDPTEIHKDLTIKSSKTLMVEIDDTEVHGKTKIQGGDGADDVTLDDVELHGKLDINLKGGDNTLDMKDVHVDGKFTYLGKNGMDDIKIDDSVFMSRVKIDTRGGADTVEIERRSAGDDGKTDFDDRVDIDLGKGDDFLDIGSSSNSTKKARFHDDVFLNGGPGGADELDLLGNNNEFDAGLDLMKFEIV